MTDANHPNSVSLQPLNRRHEDLIASLSMAGWKLGLVRLLDHIASLPDLRTAPQALFYHVDSWSRLCGAVMRPQPVSGSPVLLKELLSRINAASESPLKERIPLLNAARERVGLLLAAEFTVSGNWDAAYQALPRALSHLSPIALQRGGIDLLREAASGIPAIADLQWPYHLLPGDGVIHRGSILVVLVDGAEVPADYREAYLGLLSAEVMVLEGSANARTIVTVQGANGTRVAAGDEIQAFGHEALRHAYALVGADATAPRLQVSFNLDVRTEQYQITGRSIVLPMVIAAAQALGRALDLPRVPIPREGVAWTGDVAIDGRVLPVGGLREKVRRIVDSTAHTLAYPTPQHEELATILDDEPAARTGSFVPVAHVAEALDKRSIVVVERRSPPARMLTRIRRRKGVLGIAIGATLGVAFLLIVALVTDLAPTATRVRESVRRTLKPDRAPTSAEITGDQRHVRLLNAEQKVIREFTVPRTHLERVALTDLLGDSTPEILMGTACRDSLPGMLFCFDAKGREMWRFKGGFRPDEPPPYRLPNSFSCAGAFSRDLNYDGEKDVIAFFTHSPYFATQVALLTSTGGLVSSFWHPGHCGTSLFGDGALSMAFSDIDRDGYEELLIPGTNNSYGRAALTVLDPRSIAGQGPRTDQTIEPATWQSYILFPRDIRLHEVLRSPRMHAHNVSILERTGGSLIRMSLWTTIPDYRKAVDAFSYLLDFDPDPVNSRRFSIWQSGWGVIGAYPGDEFLSWVTEALQKKGLSLDLNSKSFRESLYDITVLPGDPRLLSP